MVVTDNFVDYEQSRLHYVKAGLGPTPLLVFHGFGQDHHAFKPWLLSFQNDFTLYAFDLFFHGKSTWTSRQPLEKADWSKIVSLFLKHENIASFQVAGFSLGGKFALATVEAFPERVSKVILLAPDGIKTSFWYSLATYPIAMRKLFRSMVLRPGRFFTLVKILRPLGLVNKGILRFAGSQMDTEEKRRRVYYSWVYFRHLQFDVSQMASIMNRIEIPLLLIVGKYDKVIPVKNMARLTKLLHKKQIEIIESGHNDLIAKAVGVITGPGFSE